MLHSFVNSTYDRPAAIALARRADGAETFRQHEELCERDFGIPRSVGSLLYVLPLIRGDAAFRALMDAIADGSNLITVAPLFNHWLIAHETTDVPADFGLNGLRAAALLVAERRLAGARLFMTPAQVTKAAAALSSPGARRGVSVAAQRIFLAQWRERAAAIELQQTYEPARWLAKTFRAVIHDAPGAAALCRSGHFGGDRPPGIAERLERQAIDLLTDCP